VVDDNGIAENRFYGHIVVEMHGKGDASDMYHLR